MKRLGLARTETDPLAAVVASAGWTPVPCHLTVLEATGAEPPVVRADAVLLLSPSAARLAKLPEGLPCLAQGEGTARALSGRPVPGGPVETSPDPDAEGLWAFLQARFPQGGDFLLARGERSRGFLERAAAGGPWRIHPWTTHVERALDPFPGLPPLDAYLAMSPLQAELFGPRSGGALRLAWGRGADEAYARVGYPGDGWCEPRPQALNALLESLLNP